MATLKETTERERADEATLDEQLASAAEKAAVAIEESNQTIRRQEQRIRELEAHGTEVVGVVSEGSAARAERMARKRRALEMLKQAGVAVMLLLVAGLVYSYPGPYAAQPVQVATLVQEAPTPGFPQRPAA